MSRDFDDTQEWLDELEERELQKHDKADEERDDYMMKTQAEEKIRDNEQ